MKIISHRDAEATERRSGGIINGEVGDACPDSSLSTNPGNTEFLRASAPL